MLGNVCIWNRFDHPVSQSGFGVVTEVVAYRKPHDRHIRLGKRTLSIIASPTAIEYEFIK